MVKQRVKNNFIKQGPIWETVEKKKIFNTLNLPFTTEREKMHHLSMHSRNIKSYKTSYYK